MATTPNRWYFSREKLLNSPTVKCGIDPEKELSYRQQAANLIQDMGQRLQVYQLCINTAIVYMHRFYMFHSFTKFPRNSIAAAALFLAAKVEEQPHKLEHVIRVAHACLHRGEPALDPRSNAYAQQAQELVINESIILQTLGFEVGVVHPHTHVVKCTQMIRASKDLSQSSYFLATNSLHLTSFSLQYKPTVVACVCIHLACKWTQWDIPKSSDGKGWWEYIDPAVTEEQLNELTREFLNIIDRCPLRLKKRIMGYRGAQAKEAKRLRAEGQQGSGSGQPKAGTSQTDGDASTSIVNDTFDYSFDNKPASGYDQFSDSEDSKADEPIDVEKLPKEKNPAATSVSAPSAAPTQEQPRKPETVKVSYEEYKRKEQERKEKERKDRELMKRQDASSGHAELALGKPHVKESRPHGHEKYPPGLDKKMSVDILKGRVSKGAEKSSGQERVHPSHEKMHTGHDRMHPHDKHGPVRKDHPSSRKHGQGQEKINSGHTRGPSGPERIPSGQERSSSGSQKAPASLGREPSTHSRHGQEKIPKGHGMKTQDKSLVSGSSSLDIAKYPASEKLREEKRPEVYPPLPPLGSNESGSIPSGENIRPSEANKKQSRDRSNSHSEKGTARSDKSSKERHQNKVERSARVHRTSEEIPPTNPEPMFNVEELASSATLDMLTQIRDEVLNQLNEDISQEKERSSAQHETASVKESTTTEHRQAKVVKPPPSMETSQVGPPSTSVAKPLHKSTLKVKKEESVEVRLQEQIPSEAPVPEGRSESHERREERKHSERKREDKERRREHHKEKKHRSHKHRHQSPHTPKLSHENDVGEGSGDMIPAKKQRLEEAGSPHTVLTTSQGIKLKIKGLSNSFNGSDHNNGSESNVNSDSPGRIKLNLKLNSSHDGSPAEGSRERDGSNHHHRSHHKHKSRHRNKDGHRKRPRSPGLSSASDASPAVSSPRKRIPDVVDGAKATLPSSQSLLNLPMPPSIVKSSSSSQHRSPSVKHPKLKQGTNPPLPPPKINNTPPPPPPPASYQYSTIDFSALYDEFPPLPNKSPDRPPPPPPIPRPQKRPPLPP